MIQVFNWVFFKSRISQELTKKPITGIEVVQLCNEIFLVLLGDFKNLGHDNGITGFLDILENGGEFSTDNFLKFVLFVVKIAVGGKYIFSKKLPRPL